MILLDFKKISDQCQHSLNTVMQGSWGTFLKMMFCLQAKIVGTVCFDKGPGRSGLMSFRLFKPSKGFPSISLDSLPHITTGESSFSSDRAGKVGEATFNGRIFKALQIHKENLMQALNAVLGQSFMWDLTKIGWSDESLDQVYASYMHSEYQQGINILIFVSHVDLKKYEVQPQNQILPDHLDRLILTSSIAVLNIHKSAAGAWFCREGMNSFACQTASVVMRLYILCDHHGHFWCKNEFYLGLLWSLYGTL